MYAQPEIASVRNTMLALKQPRGIDTLLTLFDLVFSPLFIFGVSNGFLVITDPRGHGKSIYMQES